MDKTSSGQPCIRVPVWLLSVLIPVIITIIGYSSYQIKTQSRILSTLEQHTEEIKELKTSRAYNIEVSTMRGQLNRIEDKVDKLMRGN